jgi:actin-related protein 5
MFEQYSVPSLAFCVDSVMSFYHNNLPASKAPFASDGLVVSFNTSSTSVVPILSGKGLMSHAKRYAASTVDHVVNLYFYLGSRGGAHNRPNIFLS